MATNIIQYVINEKLGGTNYVRWSLKVQFLLRQRDIIESLTASMSALAEWNENGKDVTASEQYKEKLKARQTRFKSCLLYTSPSPRD